MCPAQKARAPRRRRVAVLLGLAGLLAFDVAGAQADRDWLEGALERTMRLASPWELPARPQLEPDALPDDSLSSDSLPNDSLSDNSLPSDSLPGDSLPNNSLPNDSLPNDSAFGLYATPELDLVLEVPWGTSDQEGTFPVDASHAKLEVRLVDDFEDPWLGRAADSEEEQDPRPERETSELIDPWDEQEPRQ